MGGKAHPCQFAGPMIFPTKYSNTATTNISGSNQACCVYPKVLKKTILKIDPAPATNTDAASIGIVFQLLSTAIPNSKAEARTTTN